MAEAVPLAITPRPGPDDFRRIWREGKLVFKHPDFGPPGKVLPALS